MPNSLGKILERLCTLRSRGRKRRGGQQRVRGGARGSSVVNRPEEQVFLMDSKDMVDQEDEEVSSETMPGEMAGLEVSMNGIAAAMSE